LECGKSLLRPLEIASLERIGKALKVLLSLFEGALESLVTIGARTYASNCHTTPLQEKESIRDWTIIDGLR